jgi:hypothetical protein
MDEILETLILNQIKADGKIQELNENNISENELLLYEFGALFMANLIADLILDQNTELKETEYPLIGAVIFEQTNNVKEAVKNQNPKNIKKFNFNLLRKLKEKISGLKNLDKYSVYRKLAKYTIPITFGYSTFYGGVHKVLSKTSDIIGKLPGGRYLNLPVRAAGAVLSVPKTVFNHPLATGLAQWRLSINKRRLKKLDKQLSAIEFNKDSNKNILTVKDKKKLSKLLKTINKRVPQEIVSTEYEPLIQKLKELTRGDKKHVELSDEERNKLQKLRKLLRDEYRSKLKSDIDIIKKLGAHKRSEVVKTVSNAMNTSLKKSGRLFNMIS